MPSGKVKSSLTEFVDIVRDINMPEIGQLMDHHIDRLRIMGDQGSVGVRVVVYGGDVAQIEATFGKLKRAGVPVQVHSSVMAVACDTWDTAGVGGGADNLLSLLIFLPGYENIQDVFQHAELCCGKSPGVLVFSNADQQSAIERGLKALSTQALLFIWSVWPPAEGFDLSQFLSEKITPAQLDVLQEYAYGMALRDTKETFVLAASVEEKNLKARRQINQQQLTRLKARSGSSWQDLAASKKNNLQTQYTQFEKGLNDRIESVFKKQNGEYWPTIHAYINSIDHLEEEKRMRTVVTALTPADVQEFCRINEQFLMRFGTTDLKMYKDVLDQIFLEVDLFLQENHLGALSFHPKYMTQERLQQLVQDLIQIEKSYKGEQTRRGGHEYFTAVRKYQTLLMMALSSLGLSFVKNFNKIYMLPLTFFLLALGVINVMRTASREKEESQIKELEKAREMLVLEAKRISTDFGRSWGRILADALREQLDQLQLQLESILKSYTLQQSALEEADRNKIQRILAGLEIQERRLENAQRNLGSWERNFSRVLMDLQAAYRQTERRT